MLKPTDLILVAYTPSPRDLEIARVLGWYRIPLATAPKVVAVDYLAFYQPASFGARKWRIEVLAPVKGHELKTRSEILQDEPDHPRAGEAYYKIQLGPLEPLPRPILAKEWKRLTFLYTTGEYMAKAETLADLTVHAEERQLLWRSLRERAQSNQTYQTDSLPGDEIPPDELLALLGLIQAAG